MKKLYSIFIIFGILIMLTSTVFATDYIYNKENKMREETFKATLDSFIQTFMTEETPEHDRIKNYIYTGFGISKEGENDNKLSVNIYFCVTPVNADNTTWNKTTNYCFATYTKVDGELVLDEISRYPDYYDEFLLRFEEYKKNNPTTIENTQIQAEEMSNNLSNREIDKMSKIIFVSCSIVLLGMVIFIITKFIKYRK